MPSNTQKSEVCLSVTIPLPTLTISLSTPLSITFNLLEDEILPKDVVIK